MTRPVGLVHVGLRLELDPDVELEQFLGPIMGAVKNLPAEDRITVGIIDHANRKTAEGDEYAAGGSRAKAAGVDVVYFFKKEQRFSAAGGEIKLSRWKLAAAACSARTASSSDTARAT